MVGVVVVQKVEVVRRWKRVEEVGGYLLRTKLATTIRLQWRQERTGSALAEVRRSARAVEVAVIVDAGDMTGKALGCARRRRTTTGLVWKVVVVEKNQCRQS